MERMPRPEEVAAAVKRMAKFSSLLFVVGFKDELLTVTVYSINKVTVPDGIPAHMRPVKILVEPVIATPYLSGVLPATYYTTLRGAEAGTATRVYEPNALIYANRVPTTVTFRAVNDTARLWLRRQVAKLAGFRYEETPFAKMGANNDERDIMFREKA